MSKLLGSVKPSPGALATVRERGGDWFAYQSHDRVARPWAISNSCSVKKSYLPNTTSETADTAHAIG